MKIIIVGDAVVSTGFALSGETSSSALFFSPLDAGVTSSDPRSWSNIQMPARQSVPGWAVRFNCVFGGWRFAAQYIYSVRHRFQMRWVDACSIATQVV